MSVRITGADLFRSLTPEEFAALDTPEERERFRVAFDAIMEKASSEIARWHPLTIVPFPRWP